MYEKLEKKAPTRMNNHELLGQAMIDSGNEFGPGAAYGESPVSVLKPTEAAKEMVDEHNPPSHYSSVYGTDGRM